MKKLVSILLMLVLVLSCTTPIFAFASEVDEDATENYVEINPEEMEVGEVICIGDLVFEKAPDDAVMGPVTRATTEGFYVTNFGGNKSMDKVLALNWTYRYFRILLNNEGTGKIKVDIGGKYTTSISPGSMYIYSTTAWAAKSHTVSFSCDSGLYGSASAMLCSTLEEAKP